MNCLQDQLQMLNLFSLTACGVMESSVISFSSRLFNTLRLSISVVVQSIT